MDTYGTLSIGEMQEIANKTGDISLVGNAGTLRGEITFRKE